MYNSKGLDDPIGEGSPLGREVRQDKIKPIRVSILSILCLGFTNGVEGLYIVQDAKGKVLARPRGSLGKIKVVLGRYMGSAQPTAHRPEN